MIKLVVVKKQKVLLLLEKINAVNNMSSQMRCVTLQDYQVRIMAMPSQFGTVFRSFVRKDPNNNLGVEVIFNYSKFSWTINSS